MKNYIIIGLICILIGFGINLSIKCSKLERENSELKIEQKDIVDSIELKNDSLEKELKYFSNQLYKYEHRLDSLKKIKQTVIVKKEYIVSENLTESVKTLKENLRCEK